LGGGIGIVEMLYRCNILALVGGGNSPKYPLNKVMLWDDHQSKCIAELSFRNDVKGVRLKAEKILVILENKIYVYNFSDLKLVDHIETVKNPKGLFSLSNDANANVLACPAKEVGHVAIHCYDTKKKLSFRAHQSQIGCMELDYGGKKLATASEKGTLIRLFNTDDGTLIQEVRRGSEYAQVFSLSFDQSSKWLAVSSDTTTVHIFSLQDKDGNKDQNEGKNSKSKLSFMKVFSSYFDSEWSFAQFKVQDRKTRLAFGQENSVYIAGYDGHFYSINYDLVNGGECLKQFETTFHESK
jgi:WD40 repeat protein